MLTKLLQFLVLLIPLSLAAASNHPLTLPELVDIALNNHPSTKQTWWNAHRAASALGSAKSAYYPQVDLEAYLSNGRTYKFINGPETNYTLAGTDIHLSFLLLDFGERNANVNAAKMALLAANWQTEWNIQKVMMRVLENGYALFHAREVYQAALISLKEATVVRDAAFELHRAGLTPITDLYTSQANLSEMKMELSRQKALLDIQMGKLIASLGLPIHTALEIADISLLPSTKETEICKLMEQALQQRSDLLAKQTQHAEKVARQKQIQRSYNPKLLFSGRGGTDHYIHDHTHGAHYEVRLDFEFPLFTGFDATYQKRMAFSDTQISMEELAELELDISLEVLTYTRTLEAAQEILPDAEDYLAHSIKAYEGVLEKYKAGMERITMLSDAQQQLAQARVRYSEVKTRWLTSLANLAYATGTLLLYLEER